jgi:hypothetical protein
MTSLEQNKDIQIELIYEIDQTEQVTQTIFLEMQTQGRKTGKCHSQEQRHR